jgi:polysaccharide biosynthesis/export protein
MSLKKIIVAFAMSAFLTQAFCHGQGQAVAPASPQAGATEAGASASSASFAGIGSLTDEPIIAGEMVHILVFGAPDFSVTARVSDSGNIPYPILGAVHLAGLNSAGAAAEIGKQLKARDLIVEPEVTVTVDSTVTGITVLGEVRIPGIYAPPGKRMLSDLLAMAGGLTTNSGRIIEISNYHSPSKKEYVSWDPTMRNTDNFDRLVSPGDRVLVRSCGVIYVGGNVSRPGAYPVCGSKKVTMSEVIALAGGIAPNAKESHSYLVREQLDGTSVAQMFDVRKVLASRVADPVVHEDDIVYISPSPLKVALKAAMGFATTLTPSLLYTFYR